MRILIGVLVVLIYNGFSAPAAKQHVKKVGTNYLKYTSKLKRAVELNFTLGFHHSAGKEIIANTLDKIAAQEGFEVRHITPIIQDSVRGDIKGEIPNFTLDDLKSGQVIVANNVSMFGLSALGQAKQNALETAIEKEGIGYLGIHGSGDNEAPGWPWYTNVLHPMNYKSHGNKTEAAPVYKNEKAKDHVVLEGILETDIKTGSVPMGVDANGMEIIQDNVVYRGMANEWYRFGRDISTDPAFADKVTVLTRYDPKNLTVDALQDAYKRAGGNMFTYIYQVGKAKTSYFPPGHDNTEMFSQAHASFDHGSGDLNVYYRNILYYLAGYTPSICDTSCNGLPIVSGDDQLTGQTYPPPGAEGCKDQTACNYDANASVACADCCLYTDPNSGLCNCADLAQCPLGVRRFEALPGISISASNISVDIGHSIEIRSVKGSTVLARSAAGAAEYDLGGYEAGIYMVKITVPGLTRTRTILVK